METPEKFEKSVESENKETRAASFVPGAIVIFE